MDSYAPQDTSAAIVEPLIVFVARPFKPKNHFSMTKTGNLRISRNSDEILRTRLHKAFGS